MSTELEDSTRPGTDQTPTQAETIRFAGRSSLPTDAFDHVELFIVYLLAAVAVGCVIILRAIGLTGSSVAVGVGVATFFLPLLYFVIAQRCRISAARRAVALRPDVIRERTDDTSRLQCVGLPEWLAPEGELHAEPFEPRVFHAICGLPASPRGQGFGVLTLVLGIAGGLCLNYVLTGSWCRDSFPYMYAALCVWIALNALFYPTYVRVVPGRLDVLHYALSRSPIIERVDLRASRLVVDLTRWGVTIRPVGDAEPLVFSIAFVRGRARLAHALFLAALSPHTAPPIEPDVLAG